MRSIDNQEVQLENYAAFQDEELLTTAALERMLHGLSSRHYCYGLEPIGESLPTACTSRSTMSRRLDDRRYMVLMIDGVELAEHAVIVVLGIDAGGQKHIILGLREGATENVTVVRELISDLIERGLMWMRASSSL